MLNKILFTLSSIILTAALSGIPLSSQDLTLPDSLITGKKYNITLYNDKEIIGRVAKQDSLTAIIVTETGTVRIRKDDIFSISSSLIPKLLKASFSLGGGVLLSTGEDGYYNRKSKPGLSLQLSGLMPFDENKAVRLDLGYSHEKRDPVYYAYTQSWEQLEGQQRDMYSAYVDFVIGNFRTDSRFSVYGIAGAGLTYIKETDYVSSHYISYDSTIYSYTYEGLNTAYFSLTLGGGFRFRVANKLGAYAEVQYTTFTYENYFWFFGGGYFPIRAGLTYSFY